MPGPSPCGSGFEGELSTIIGACVTPVRIGNPRCTLGNMARARTSFVCDECGATQSQWMGRCPECGTWDSLAAFKEPAGGDEGGSGGDAARSGPLASLDDEATAACPIHEIDLTDLPRLPTAIEEVDRVLGGGFVPGSSILLGGDPGIGKSTLLMQVAGAISGQGGGVLYASSEESAAQVRMRAERLGVGRPQDTGGLYVLAETDLGRVLKEALRLKPSLLILDSIQMAWLGGSGNSLDRGRGGSGGSGAASQLRRCASELSILAKKTGMTVVIVGHVTKEGTLAGPKLLEHLVDVVLAFEGDQHHRHRILRGIKNRFGSTQEIGLFQMSSDGLEPVNEDLIRLDSEAQPAPGAVVVPTLAGSRCLLAEIQGLTATGFLGSAKRRAAGVDAARLAMLIAVLEKHGGLRLADQDVFVSVAGGLRVLEPGVDLATALAIAGAHYGRALEPGTAVFGEVTLSGAVRPAAGVQQRVSEALRRGARRILLPQGQASEIDEAHRDRLVQVPRLVDALNLLEPVAKPQPGASGASGTPGDLHVLS